MSQYFSDASFKFLRNLDRHNNKAWFAEHKHEYEEHVRQPFLRLIAEAVSAAVTRYSGKS